MKTLRLVLGDQLSESISSLKDHNPKTDLILMCEVWEEASYVRHHKKKIAFLFSAMRHFARELRQNGYEVEYTKLDDPENCGSFKGEVGRVLQRHSISRIIVTHPSEYRVLLDIQNWSEEFGLPVEIREDTRFLCTQDEFAEWAKGRKNLRMEYFYREMRKMHDILMQGDKPEGGQWNYDSENRKPPREGLNIPSPYTCDGDDITQEVLSLVSDRFKEHFGELEPFNFAVTRKEALKVLDRFVEQRLNHFGDYQDAMIEGEPWMYHSHISFYLNCGLLLPLECVQAAESAYKNKKAPLNAVEGFIRQIIGWREYVRGIYWFKMPAYVSENFFQAKRQLPDFYWTSETKMNCLRCCVSETKQNAYAHHIQRLMVLGNFALLAGIDPKYVNEWFLIVYADAYEWVELPNVSGMILFADGGYLASKPYAAGGSYINKMSDYCKGCSYKVTKKNGPDACPFNYLYWDFLDRNRDKLQNNHRIAMMYKTFDRMETEKQNAIRDDSQRFFKSVESGAIV
ncbi:cryptochrome/photolyase family protein [Sneathiella limimaris]|uniref:cryptochrome/photolyase family protein n=1 Tax=Sneathiella limimaris TaxID=1964213 RepID=UPI00146DE35C|nr:cryptochrome/photolyase family protein [Sneathiella limimaris]